MEPFYLFFLIYYERVDGIKTYSLFINFVQVTQMTGRWNQINGLTASHLDKCR